MEECNSSRTPYRSGIRIDRIEHDGIEPSNKAALVTAFQSILGSLNWLSINTRPDIAVAYKLLSQFNSNPSQGHLDAAKYVLRYLKGTSTHGICFAQDDNLLHACIGLPPEINDKDIILFTDSNWGPQDASKPKENDTHTVTMEELRSIQGFHITRMGGPLYWGVSREKRGSRSSCIAELKAIDEGIKGIQFIRHLMIQLGLPNINKPTPILNDNRGSLDWIESGCRPSKKLRHENLAELGIEEAKNNNEVSFYWTPGSSNPADIYTKEDHNVQHYESIRDQILMRREDFGVSFTPVANRGVLNSRSGNRKHENYLTTRTKSKSMTHHEDESLVIGKIVCPPITSE